MILQRPDLSEGFGVSGGGETRPLRRLGVSGVGESRPLKGFWGRAEEGRPDLSKGWERAEDGRPDLSEGSGGEQSREDHSSQRVGPLMVGGRTNPAGRLSNTMRRRSGGHELSCDVAHHRTALTISCCSPQSAAW